MLESLTRSPTLINSRCQFCTLYCSRPYDIAREADLADSEHCSSKPLRSDSSVDHVVHMLGSCSLTRQSNVKSPQMSTSSSRLHLRRFDVLRLRGKPSASKYFQCHFHSLAAFGGISYLSSLFVDALLTQETLSLVPKPPWSQ